MFTMPWVREELARTVLCVASWRGSNCHGLCNPAPGRCSDFRAYIQSGSAADTHIARMVDGQQQRLHISAHHVVSGKSTASSLVPAMSIDRGRSLAQLPLLHFQSSELGASQRCGGRCEHPTGARAPVRLLQGATHSQAISTVPSMTTDGLLAFVRTKLQGSQTVAQLWSMRSAGLDNHE